jgi:hypothetical protein
MDENIFIVALNVYQLRLHKHAACSFALEASPVTELTLALNVYFSRSVKQI